jgi:GxxExxY protein
MPVDYKGVRLDCGYRVDVLVDDRLILELKAVEAVSGIHKAQLLTYMKLPGIKTGLLINFNVPRLADGIERFKL